MRTEAELAVGSRIAGSNHILEVTRKYARSSIKTRVSVLGCVTLYLSYCIHSPKISSDAATVDLAASGLAQWPPRPPPPPAAAIFLTQPRVVPARKWLYPSANLQAYYQPPLAPHGSERNLQESSEVRYAQVIGDGPPSFIAPTTAGCLGQAGRAFCLDPHNRPSEVPMTRQQQGTLALDRPPVAFQPIRAPSFVSARVIGGSGRAEQLSRDERATFMPQYSAASSQVFVKQGGFLQDSRISGIDNSSDVSDNTVPKQPLQTRFQQQQQQQQQLRRPLEKSSLHKALMGLQNPLLLGGDILLRTGRNRRPAGRLVHKYERSALVSPIQLWPNGIIYYELDPSVSHLASLIYKVMRQFHAETCIRFIEREPHEPDYLRIEALRGCFSYIGRIGGEQTLSLGDGCEYRGTIAHELLHAVGFYHHQNRSDRDDFLEIIWDNIAKGKESQFTKMAPEENILLNDFDYQSIMLYGPRTFGKTLDKITMKPKRGGVNMLEVVEKQGLSSLDVDSVNKLYKCPPQQQQQQSYTFRLD